MTTIFTAFEHFSPGVRSAGVAIVFCWTQATLAVKQLLLRFRPSLAQIPDNGGLGLAAAKTKTAAAYRLVNEFEVRSMNVFFRSVTFQKSGARNYPFGSIGNLKISNVLLGMYVKFLLRPNNTLWVSQKAGAILRKKQCYFFCFDKISVANRVRFREAVLRV